MEQAIDSFLLYLAAERGLSPQYRRSVAQTLCAFADWCREHKLTWADVQPDTFTAYRKERRLAGIAPSSLRVETVHPQNRIYNGYSCVRKWSDCNFTTE